MIADMQISHQVLLEARIWQQ